MNSTPSFTTDYPAGCPSCAHVKVSVEEIVDNFEYGQGAELMHLSARVPVYTCMNCGFSFTDYIAEELRHSAVCSALAVLNPNQVKEIRERLGLSQADFADISGIGKASLGRWERGALIQNESNDNLLRLLSYPDNIERIRNKSKIKPQSNIISFERKFKSLPRSVEPNLRKRAMAFRLNG